VALLASASARADYKSTVLGDGPVAYYHFNETVATGIPYPTFANSGTNTGGSGYVAWLPSTSVTSDTTNIGLIDIGFNVPGALNDVSHTALYFPDAYSNEVIVPYNAGLNVTGPFSVEVWLKGCPRWGTPISSTDGSTGGWLLYQGDVDEATGNGFWWRIYNGSTASTLDFNLTLNPSLWYHVVAVYDGVNQTVFLNGAQVGTKAATVTYTPTATQPIRMGTRYSGSYGYRGYLDSPAIYNYALTASQAAAHYAAATNNAAGYAAVILGDNPAAFWEFNEKFSPPVAVNSGTGGAPFNAAYYGPSSTAVSSTAPSGLGANDTLLDLSTNPVGAAVVIPPLNLNTNTVTFECLIKPTYDQTLNYNTIFAGVVVHRNVLANNTACGLDFASATTLGYEWNTKNAAEPIPAFDSGLTPIEGSWNYVALTISPTTATVYLYDGTNWSVSVDSGHTNFAAQAFNGPTCIGFDPLQRTNFFNGSVDEVAIYNKTLTEGQLHTHALAAFSSLGAPQFVNSTPVVSPATIYVGTPYTLSIEYFGANSTYEWRSGNGGNQTIIPGATNSSYIVPSATVADGALYYDVIVSNAKGVITSGQQQVPITAAIPLSGVAVLPAAESVFPGGNATFTAAATGSGLAYQWQLNGTNLSGATASTLVLANVNAGQSGNYTVVVTNVTGSVTSSPAATLTVAAPAAGSYQQAVVSDGPEGYWRLNEAGTETNAGGGVIIFDSMGRHDGLCYGNSPTTEEPLPPGTAYSTANMTFSQPGIAGTSDTSILFTLPMYGIDIPYSPALNLASNFSYECWLQPGPSWTSASGFTEAMGCLDSAGDASSAWRGYCIMINAFGAEEWSSYMANGWLRSDFGTSTALFSNANFNGATEFTHVVCVESNGQNIMYLNGAYAGEDNVAFSPNLYWDLWIGSAVYAPGTRGWNGYITEAAYYPTPLSPARILAHYELGAYGSGNLPIFAEPPASQTVVEGSAVSFGPVVVGAPTITNQWQFNGTNITGATGPTLSFASIDYTNAGKYTLIVTNQFGGASSSATLIVVPPASVTNLTWSISTGASGQKNLSLTWPSGTLYSTTNLAGPWTAVSGATQPYYQTTINPGTPSMFFKAQ
jgi:hypothetical protein